MTPERTVSIKVEADTDDALRKLREVGREARRTRRAVSGTSNLTTALDVTLALMALIYFIAGVVQHDTYHVAFAAVLLLLRPGR